MGTRKMRVELSDGEGNRYAVSFEGQVTREKALRLLDVVELLGGMPTGRPNPDDVNIPVKSTMSKFDRLRSIVQKNFPVVWFSSREVQTVYEQEHKEPIGLSTVATYLSRLATKGIVLRAGAVNNPRYKVALGTEHVALKPRLP